MDIPGAGSCHRRSGCHLRTDGHPRDQLWLSRAAGAWPGAASQKYPEPQLGLGTQSGNTAEPHSPAAQRLQLSHALRTDGQLSSALPWTIPAAPLSPLCVGDTAAWGHGMQHHRRPHTSTVLTAPWQLLGLLPPPKHRHISSLQGGMGMDLQEHLQSSAEPQHPGCAREHHPNLPETLGFLPGSFNPKFNICYPLPSPQPSLPQVRPPWCSPPGLIPKGSRVWGVPPEQGGRSWSSPRGAGAHPIAPNPHCWVTEGVQALLCSYSR